MKNMTKIGGSLCALMLAAAMLLTSCGRTGTNDQTNTSGSSAQTSAETSTQTGATTDENPAGQPTADEAKTAEEIVGEIYSQLEGDVEFPSLESRSLDLGDVDAFRYVFGIDPPSSARDAEVSEPLIGSIPYTLAVLTLDSDADIQSIADAIRTGVDPAKWICVTATVVDVIVNGNSILLIMDSDIQRAGAIKSAFENIDV
ncbi:MAG: hypothetical protein ACI3YK_03310 [Eubacteriales bacterium]